MSKLDMSDKRLDKLKLTQKTVIELFYNCRKTDKTTSVTNATYYDETSTRKAPIAQLDSHKVLKSQSQIIYLLGQLQAIHDKRPLLTPGAGFIDYTGKKWTNDNKALSALYYLATSTGFLQRFVDGEKYAYSDLTIIEPFVKPTYPPGDPRFNIKDAKRALNEIGIKLPDDQTHVD